MRYNKKMEKLEDINKEQNKVETLTNKEDGLIESNKEKKIETIQAEEKEFLDEIKESTLDVFHFASKEKFQKAFRTVALATVLLTSIGEKAFAERDEHIKDPAAVITEIDKEIEQIIATAEIDDEIDKQRDLIKEKYDQEIIIGEDFSFEELKDLDDALEIVHDLAPKKFNELKLIFWKHDLKILKEQFVAFPNAISGASELKEIEDKSSNEIDFIKRVAINSNTNKIDSNKKNNYEIILIPNKTDMNYADIAKSLTCFWRISISNRESFVNSYRDTIIHEFGHIIPINDSIDYEKMEDKFDKLNDKVVEGKTINEILEDVKNPKLKRPNGCVSAYAVTANNLEKAYLSSRGTSKAQYNSSESIAEVFSYMALGFNYADDDLIVQEKIKVLEEFLNEKSNE
ncbi:hypothetical protein HN615_06680 [Candidatus Woesearchaeota archaeon]|nr:hypothetical protein [Candidatus Woesearchaeota archaeon]